MNPEAIEAAKAAVAKEMRLRTYDRHAHNRDVFEEGVADIAAAALEAAAPYLVREARAAELEAAAFTFTGDFITGDYNSTPQQVGDFLRDRAAAIRAGHE